MELIKARNVQLMWDGDALIGPDLVKGVGGFGLTAGEALRDLAAQIKARGVTIWVPQKAKQYVEGGVLKADCPECGHTHQMPGLDRVIAYICEACGAAVDVLPRSPRDDG